MTFWWRRWIEAVPFAQMDQLTVVVAENLHFHMPRIDQGLFEDQLVAAKTVQGFRARAAQLLQQVLGPLDQAHASAPATGAGLDHQRVADAPGFALQRVVVLGGALVTGDAGNAGFNHGDFCPALAAHQVDGLGAGADEHDAGRFAGPGEPGIFRKKAVAGMDRIGPAAPGCIENRRGVEVGLLHRGRADQHGFIGHAHVQRIGVSLAEHRHGAIAQRLGGALDPAGDFATVGDEDFAEGGHGVIPGFLRCLSGPHREQALLPQCPVSAFSCGSKACS